MYIDHTKAGSFLCVLFMGLTWCLAKKKICRPFQPFFPHPIRSTLNLYSVDTASHLLTYFLVFWLKKCASIDGIAFKSHPLSVVGNKESLYMFSSSLTLWMCSRECNALEEVKEEDFFSRFGEIVEEVVSLSFFLSFFPFYESCTFNFRIRRKRYRGKMKIRLLWKRHGREFSFRLEE